MIDRRLWHPLTGDYVLADPGVWLFAPDKPKYVIFFKARDSDALKQALTEYADKVTTQKERKPSVLQKLRDYVAVVQNRVLERSKDKQKGQER